MKLTMLLITAAFLNVSANGFSQHVSFSGKNVPLDKVLSEVEKQTGYVFFFNEAILQRASTVSIEATNEKLDDFLVRIFKNQPFSFKIQNKAVIVKEKEPASDLKNSKEMLAPSGNVKGRVTNEDGEPLAGANIILKGGTQAATTDINGFYQIENVAEGTYTLEISYVGYATKTTTIKVSANGNAAFDIKLVPSLVNLDQLTVTSTLSSRKIRSVPTTMAVIKQEDLKNRNITNITNVLEAIPGIIITPGSEVENSGNARIPSNVLIRGTSAGATIKYLIDGVEMVSTIAINILQTMDPNNIEKIEILKGPMASTLYGNGAAGGVIAITTKRGIAGKAKINFKTMFTQYKDYYADYNAYGQDYSLNASGGSEQFNYFVGASYNLYPRTKLTDVNNGIDDKTWSYTAKFNGKLKNILADVSLQYGTAKTGSGTASSSDNKFRESLGFPPYPTPALSDVKNNQRSFLTSLHLKNNFTNNWYQDLTVGYNMVNYLNNYYTPNYYNYYNNYENLYSKINVRYFMFHDHAWSENLNSNITAGFEYNAYETHFTIISTTTPVANFIGSSTPAVDGAGSFQKAAYSSKGYFAEVVTGFKDKLFLTTGIRFDDNPAYGDKVGLYAQPRVGLSYVVKTGKFNIKPRAAWGVSSAPPEPTYKTSYTVSYPGYDIVNIGNPDIKPQRSQGYEMGADIYYGDNLALNVTYYDQKIRDMIYNAISFDASTNPPALIAYATNVSEAVNRGIEIAAKAVVEPFTIDISYTKTTSKWGDKIPETPSAIIFPGAPNIGIPKYSMYARLSCAIPALLPWSKNGGNISLDWRYNGSSFLYDDVSYSLATYAWSMLPDPSTTPYPNFDDYLVWQKGYSYFNLRADYAVTNYATLYTDVQNLFNKHGSANGQILKPFPGTRINFGLNISF